MGELSITGCKVLSCCWTSGRATYCTPWKAPYSVHRNAERYNNVWFPNFPRQAQEKENACLSTSLNYLAVWYNWQTLLQRDSGQKLQGFFQVRFEVHWHSCVRQLVLPLPDLQGQSWDVLSSRSPTKAKVISVLLSWILYSLANLYI